MSEQTLKVIKEFDALPQTEEKDEIKRKYLTDEIGSFDFFSQASRYLTKVKEL